MEDLSTRTVQEVLDDHLKLDEHFGAEEVWRRIVEEDIRRNVSEDIVKSSKSRVPSPYAKVPLRPAGVSGPLSW